MCLKAACMGAILKWLSDLPCLQAFIVIVYKSFYCKAPMSSCISSFFQSPVITATEATKTTIRWTMTVMGTTKMRNSRRNLGTRSWSSTSY